MALDLVSADREACWKTLGLPLPNITVQRSLGKSWTALVDSADSPITDGFKRIAASLTGAGGR